MIEFSSYDFIQEEDVEAIIKTDSTRPEYPFVLTIRCRSGREYSVNYRSEEKRDSAARQFALQVDRSVHHRRVDKRGLRIWQQLKALLGVKVEEQNG